MHKLAAEDDISLQETEATEAHLIESPESKSSQRNSRYDLSKLGEDELIVREETRVSISWSRDNSPAPNNAAAVSQTKETGVGAEKSEPAEQDKPSTSAEARKKLQLSNIPLKSSQIKREPQKEEPQQETLKSPPSKALLQKIAMKETEPRNK